MNLFKVNRFNAWKIYKSVKVTKRKMPPKGRLLGQEWPARSTRNRNKNSGLMEYKINKYLLTNKKKMERWRHGNRKTREDEMSNP